MREFDPAYVGSGSFTTDAVEATRACLSAVARKRTSSRSSRYVRSVPKAAVSNRSKNSYSITWSAMASRCGGAERPSVRAVCTLMTSLELG
jgi:hypothetical protein